MSGRLCAPWDEHHHSDMLLGGLLFLIDHRSKEYLFSDWLGTVLFDLQISIIDFTLRSGRFTWLFVFFSSTRFTQCHQRHSRNSKCFLDLTSIRSRISFFSVCCAAIEMLGFYSDNCTPPFVAALLSIWYCWSQVHNRRRSRYKVINNALSHDNWEEKNSWRW